MFDYSLYPTNTVKQRYVMSQLRLRNINDLSLLEFIELTAPDTCWVSTFFETYDRYGIKLQLLNTTSKTINN